MDGSRMFPPCAPDNFGKPRKPATRFGGPGEIDSLLMICPLCRSRDLVLLERLSFEAIKALYRSRFRISRKDSVSELHLMNCRECDLKFYDPSPTGNGEFYEALSRNPWYYLPEKEEYELALRCFSESDSVLEIGAGSGAFAEKLRVSKYAGIDLNAVAAAQARAKGFDVRHETIEEHAAGCRDCYDVVCSFQVLEHIPEVRCFLSAAIECVKSGGLMIHSVPSEDSFMGKQANNILNLPPHHATRWSDTALRNVAQIFGLELIDIFHEALSDEHVRSYCVQRIQSVINSILGRPDRTLDPAYLSLGSRALIRAIALPWERRLRNASSRPTGHSVIAVYRKPCLSRLTPSFRKREAGSLPHDGCS